MITKKIFYKRKEDENYNTKNKETKKVVLQIWDIAGSEKYKKMTKIYYNGARGAILVCDVKHLLNKEKKQNVEKECIEIWKEDLDRHIIPNIPCILVLSKSDNPFEEKINESDYNSDQNNKLLEIGSALCHKYNFLSFFITSSKNNINVDIIFNTLIHNLFFESKLNYDNNINNKNEKFQKKSILYNILFPFYYYCYK